MQAFILYTVILLIAVGGAIYVRFFDKDEEDLETA